MLACPGLSASSSFIMLPEKALYICTFVHICKIQVSGVQIHIKNQHRSNVSKNGQTIISQNIQCIFLHFRHRNRTSTEKVQH